MVLVSAVSATRNLETESCLGAGREGDPSDGEIEGLLFSGIWFSALNIENMSELKINLIHTLNVTAVSISVGFEKKKKNLPRTYIKGPPKLLIA